MRGLQEELGIAVQDANVHGPLTPAHLRKLDTPSGVHDYEFVESYRYAGAAVALLPTSQRPHRLDSWEGPLSVDDTEVQGVRWVAMADMREQMLQEPEQFTQWCREELQHLGWG